MGAFRDAFEGLAIESKQDSMISLLDSIDTFFAASDLATQTTLDALLTELQSKVETTDLATLSTAAKQDAAKVVLDNILLAVDGLEGNTDEIEAKLDAINAQDFATETTLSQVHNAVDELEARIGEVSSTPTVNTIQDRLKGIKTVLDSVDGNDFATQTTLTSVLTELQAINTNTDGLEATLTDVDLNTDQIETQLTSIFTELLEKLEAGDITGLATAAKQDLQTTELQQIEADVEAVNTTLGSPRQEDGHGATTLDPTFVEVTNPTTDPETGLAKETTLQSIEGKDFATQTTLAAVLTELGSKLEPSDLLALATAAKQDTQIAAEQAIQAAVEGTLATQEQNPITGYALDITVGNRYSGGKSAKVATITASGNTTVHTPASGNAIRLFWVSAINDPDEATTPLIEIRLGTTPFYRGYAVAHWEMFEGAVNEALIVNLSGAASVAFTAHYQEFTP